MAPRFLRRVPAQARFGDRCYALFDGDALAAYGCTRGCPPRSTSTSFSISTRVDVHVQGYTSRVSRKAAARGRMCRALSAFTDDAGKGGLLRVLEQLSFPALRDAHGLPDLRRDLCSPRGGQSLSYATRAAVTMAFASITGRKQPGCGRRMSDSPTGITLGGLYVQPSLRPVDRAEDLQFHRVAQAVAVRRRASPSLRIDRSGCRSCRAQGGARLEAVLNEIARRRILYPVRVVVGMWIPYPA